MCTFHYVRNVCGYKGSHWDPESGFTCGNTEVCWLKNKYELCSQRCLNPYPGYPECDAEACVCPQKSYVCDGDDRYLCEDCTEIYKREKRDEAT